MILCCGEALIDMVPTPAVQGGSAFLPCPGGSPYNSAIALGRLGRGPGFLGALSTDFFGEQLVARLGQNGVSTALVRRVARPSTLAFVNIQPSHDPEYAFYMEGSADRSLAPHEVPGVLPAEAECILAGSISLAMEPCGSTIEALLARESGTRLLSFDPNIRASMIPDKERYLERLARLLAMATIVKISEVDLAWIYPGKSTDEAFAALFGLATAGRQAQNPLLAVVTRGHEGAQAALWQAGKVGEVRAAGFSVTVKDTIGAGDTFHAGILAWLESRGLLSREALGSLEPSVLEEGLRYANAAAAITCSRRGAEPPLAAEVEAFLASHGAA